MPSLEGNLDDGTSQPLTPSPALQSSGPLGTAAETSPPAPWDPAQQGVALEGRWLFVTTHCHSTHHDHTCPTPGVGIGQQAEAEA